MEYKKKIQEILLVGLGLMGGSYAIALKKKNYRIRAITRTQSSIDFAVDKGIIDEGATEVNKAWVKEADLIIFAIYPQALIEWIDEYGYLIEPGTLVTDVTGVKVAIVAHIQNRLQPGAEFIASHPMAGREVYGVENATDKIFQGANFIVTPSANNTAEGIEACKQLGSELGFARISVLSPEDHDDMIGFLSQLTHCIAVSLMTSNDSDHLVDYTGDSFRDLTRIAKINEDMWTELFLLNKDSLLSHMDAFEASFDELKTALKDEDEEKMKKLMRKSTNRRKLFD